MRTRILFFGILKEIAGRPADTLDVPEGSDLRTVFAHYADRFPRLRDMSGSIVIARNHEFAPLSTAVADGDEIAFLPPVSGGSNCIAEIVETGRYFALTRHAIDVKGAIARILTGAEGAVVTFEGTVRNNTAGRPTRFLDYEAYEPMALKTMAQLGRDIAADHPITGIAIVHRLGRMLIGETSVAVIVASPHRRLAFETALEGIDRLKKTVPIWKKEYFADGEVWVEGEWGADVSHAG
ncbi:MAG TPA: molybdenum cofactor biosynthesis protein MoaE [Candidatus Limnocylindrales bacterium]|nr:molybdenum cofactor biosynthesis protein MoaE [Candidatus Limnocylindrales bacterium]